MTTISRPNGRHFPLKWRAPAIAATAVLILSSTVAGAQPRAGTPDRTPASESAQMPAAETGSGGDPQTGTPPPETGPPKTGAGGERPKRRPHLPPRHHRPDADGGPPPRLEPGGREAPPPAVEPPTDEGILDEIDDGGPIGDLAYDNPVLARAQTDFSAAVRACDLKAFLTARERYLTELRRILSNRNLEARAREHFEAELKAVEETKTPIRISCPKVVE
jgi:hypothetical protein